MDWEWSIGIHRTLVPQGFRALDAKAHGFVKGSIPVSGFEVHGPIQSVGQVVQFLHNSGSFALSLTRWGDSYQVDVPVGALGGALPVPPGTGSLKMSRLVLETLPIGPAVWGSEQCGDRFLVLQHDAQGRDTLAPGVSKLGEPLLGSFFRIVLLDGCHGRY